MKGIDRLSQMIELGVPVRIGQGYAPINFDKPSSVAIVGIFPDGTKEYASRYGRITVAKEQEQMLELLRKDGIDTENTRGLKKRLEADVHTLVLPNREMYQFLLPSREYLIKKR